MQWVLNSNFTALFLTCKIESANKEEEERGEQDLLMMAGNSI